jgi:hypothetical protein
VEFLLHHFTVTLWSDVLSVASLACSLVGVSGGIEHFEKWPNGARGFRDLYIGPGGVKLYAGPHSGEGYASLEFPGDLVKSISPEGLQAHFGGLRCRWQVTRLDLAFDHSLFTPGDVFSAVEAGDVRSLAKRKTLKEIRKPFDGGHTVYFGSRQSERMLRTYLRDGHTRTELEMKGRRADAVFRDLLTVAPSEWAKRVLAHLRDFVDFGREWWSKFCEGVERAHMVLSKWAVESFNRSRAWLEKQVASTLALYADVAGFGEVVRLLDLGRQKYRPRHRVMLAAAGLA